MANFFFSSKMEKKGDKFIFYFFFSNPNFFIYHFIVSLSLPLIFSIEMDHYASDGYFCNFCILKKIDLIMR